MKEKSDGSTQSSITSKSLFFVFVSFVENSKIFGTYKAWFVWFFGGLFCLLCVCRFIWRATLQVSF
jgi:hypothetical protein